VNRQVVEPLLQKVALSGPTSLTADERAVLDRFSAR
jgi:hypothetical protein